MGTETKIQWAHHTYNPWRGCTKVSPGCANCYAEKFSKQNPRTLGVWGAGGTRIVASMAMRREVLAWNQEAARVHERRRVFCASLADVFEEWGGRMLTARHTPYWWCQGSLSNSPVPSGLLPDGCRLATMDDFRAMLFELIDETPHLDWLLLTKRPERMARWIEGATARGFWPKPNVWLGVSIENQETAWERVPVLLSIKAPLRFLSVEPLLEEIILRQPFSGGGERNYLSGQFHHMPAIGVNGQPDFTFETDDPKLPRIHWVIVGGESGSKARVCQMPWIRSLVDQCHGVGTPVFIKQLGAKAADEVNGLAGKSLFVPEEARKLVSLRLVDNKGGNPAEWPLELQIREMPCYP